MEAFWDTLDKNDVTMNENIENNNERKLSQSIEHKILQGDQDSVLRLRMFGHNEITRSETVITETQLELYAY